MKHKIPLLLLIVLLGLCTYSYGKEKSYGNIDNVEFIKNYDGDTLTFNIPGYPSVLGDNISVRVFGIDTPEMHGKCVLEKKRAQDAKQFVADKLTCAKSISLHDVMRDKYFRILAKVFIDGEDLSDLLISEGLAVSYDGGTKTKNWCRK